MEVNKHRVIFEFTASFPASKSKQEIQRSLLKQCQDNEEIKKLIQTMNESKPGEFTIQANFSKLTEIVNSTIQEDKVMKLQAQLEFEKKRTIELTEQKKKLEQKLLQLESSAPLPANQSTIEGKEFYPILDASDKGNGSNNTNEISTEQIDSKEKIIESLLVYNLMEENWEETKKLINENKNFDVNFNNGVLLRIAVGNNNLELVELLVRNFETKININVDNGEPLKIAAYAGYFNILKFLLENGGDQKYIKQDNCYRHPRIKNFIDSLEQK